MGTNGAFGHCRCSSAAQDSRPDTDRIDHNQRHQHDEDSADDGIELALKISVFVAAIWSAATLPRVQRVLQLVGLREEADARLIGEDLFIRRAERHDQQPDQRYAR